MVVLHGLCTPAPCRRVTLPPAKSEAWYRIHSFKAPRAGTHLEAVVKIRKLMRNFELMPTDLCLARALAVRVPVPDSPEAPEVCGAGLIE